MGFCFFNNVAVGAAHALEEHGCRRVAILDFDVHHGNGTEAIFRDDPRVLLCSTFQHPFYPYCGADSGNQHIINAPLAAGSGGAEFRSAVQREWLPVVERFQPEFVFISAGFDAHREDDRAFPQFAVADYIWVTERIKVSLNVRPGRIAFARGRLRTRCARPQRHRTHTSACRLVAYKQ
jgi:acetoin utilization deacetylase AcuC-like enzyme